MLYQLSYSGIGATAAAGGMLTLGVVQNVRANAAEDLGVYGDRRDVAIVGYVGSGVLAGALFTTNAP